MYSYQDFVLLEKMTDEELHLEIAKAKEVYEECQCYFNEIEREWEEQNPFKTSGLDLSILLKQLHNIESYIRKAENMMHEYDNARYLVKARTQRLKIMKINKIGLKCND